MACHPLSLGAGEWQDATVRLFPGQDHPCVGHFHNVPWCSLRLHFTKTYDRTKDESIHMAVLQCLSVAGYEPQDTYGYRRECRTRSRERLCAVRTLMPARCQFPSHSLTFIPLLFGWRRGGWSARLRSRTSGASSQKNVVFNVPHYRLSTLFKSSSIVQYWLDRQGVSDQVNGRLHCSVSPVNGSTVVVIV
jgi:hypothetical protein